MPKNVFELELRLIIYNRIEKTVLSGKGKYENSDCRGRRVA